MNKELFDSTKKQRITFDIQCTFDGCSKGNPGPGGFGWSISTVGYGWEYIPHCTNNEAEYGGLAGLLKAIIDRVPSEPKVEICIRGDSKLVICQINGNWKPPNIKTSHNLIKPYQHCLEMVNKINKRHLLTLEWSPREYNFIADRLANLSVKKQSTYFEEIMNVDIHYLTKRF